MHERPICVGEICVMYHMELAEHIYIYFNSIILPKPQLTDLSLDSHRCNFGFKSLLNSLNVMCNLSFNCLCFWTFFSLFYNLCISHHNPHSNSKNPLMFYTPSDWTLEPVVQGNTYMILRLYFPDDIGRRINDNFRQNQPSVVVLMRINHFLGNLSVRRAVCKQF